VLRALLAERFKLVVHEERRDMPVYSLVLARPDRKLGERLRPFEGECMKPEAVPKDLKAPWIEPIPAPRKGPSPCILFTGMGRLSAEGTSLSDLARTLGRFPAVQRRVIDRTGLTGAFDYDLEWTPPNIFTALQAQLGLELKSARETVAVLVIDSVNQPSPN
jgi:uncharacterized protein (TIGR03435 family)